MPLVVQDLGHDNRISIDPDTTETAHGVLTLCGSGNRVSLGPGTTLAQASLTLGDNCSLVVGAGCRLAAVEIMAERDGHVEVGPRTEFTWSTRLYLHEPGRIAIGADCLIASGTLLTNSDMHSILDDATGERINPAADVVLGDRVWLAHEATVLKGATVGDGSVVGHRAVVSGAVPAASLAVGVPARVVRTGISWDRRLL